MFDIAWMAWTPATVLFYAAILAALVTLTVLAIRFPETERVGILRIPTTRGDRLFVTLLGAAFIHLAFLAVFGADTIATLPIRDGVEISRLWIGSLISLVYGVAVFRFA